MAASENWPSEGPQHRRNGPIAARAPIPIMLGVAVALALPAAAAAAPTTPGLPLPNVAIHDLGPYPQLSGLGARLSGISLGWHGLPPASAAVKLPNVATRDPGPYPALSGLGARLSGGIGLGWHGAPPASAAAKRAIARASHRRQHAGVSWAKKK
jgi:hypothetical protein